MGTGTQELRSEPGCQLVYPVVMGVILIDYRSLLDSNMFISLLFSRRCDTEDAMSC